MLKTVIWSCFVALFMMFSVTITTSSPTKMEVSVSGIKTLAQDSGTCCPETGSKCYINGELKERNHYYLTSGSCNQIIKDETVD